MNINDFQDGKWTSFSPAVQMEKLREAFLQNNWQGLKSENERLVIAQRLEDYNTQQLGRPPVQIHIGGVPNGAGAVSTTDKNHVEHIGIVKEMLDGSEKSKDQLIEAVFHEGRHAYQRYLVFNYNKLSKEAQDKIPQEDKENLSVWEKNYFGYCAINPIYARQPVEMDAYSYGERKANEFFDCNTLINEKIKGYKDYRDELNTYRGNYAKYSESHLGMDDTKKIDIMIRANFSGLEYNKLRELTQGKLSEAQKQKLTDIINVVQPLGDLSNNTVQQMMIEQGIERQLQAIKRLPLQQLQQNQQQYQQQYQQLVNQYNQVSKKPTLANMDNQRLKQTEQELMQVEKQIKDLARELQVDITLDKSVLTMGKFAKDSVLDVSSTNQQDIDTMANLATISDLKSTLNGQMDEINKQQTELNQKRDQVKGDPLTKLQAEKMAASDYVKGADKQLDQQAKALQLKQDKLSQTEKEIIAFGKEHGLDKTLWRHAPEIFKGEGLKNYESSLAAIEHNKKVFEKQMTEIQVKREQLQERLNTPTARSEIIKKSEEYLAQDKERLTKLEPLDQKLYDLNKEQRDIRDLKNAIPSKISDKEINLQGDVNDAKNILGQADQIKLQAIEIQQTMKCGQSYSR